ncbi:pre-rRNA-processing protein TSR2 homolog [Hemiscyllium ocellatum]|uniref:pre-rRNA-processing protein TSR2 homolog n=1 Tax=Hemiscyllium ocellatum TaxID=170820 RepID=UPI002965E3F0|nr:pre-rRNA-processing protein TSR2 homolog [Hemiscyllium ocellatum]
MLRPGSRGVMAAVQGWEARTLFTEGVRSALGAWPALQVAVENGFGGADSQQKAAWMVTAVAEYFHDNVNLEPEEVEDLLADLLYNEFDTAVEDGSLSEVAQQLHTLSTLCCRGQEAEVRGHILQLTQRKDRVRVNAVCDGSPGQDEEDDEEEEEEEEGDGCAEAMECESRETASDPTLPGTPAAAHREEQADGWTVVRRKRR